MRVLVNIEVLEEIPIRRRMCMRENPGDMCAHFVIGCDDLKKHT